MKDAEVIEAMARSGFDALRQANIARQQEWDVGNQLTLTYRGNELAGEVGEACNVIKKVERERLGIKGSRDTLEHLAEELADVVICVDLIAMSEGIDLWKAVRDKFNATSEKVGLQTRLTTPTPHDGLTDTSHHAGSSAGELDWRRIAKAAGTHGVRYRTNSALEAFLREIAASPAAVGVPREVSKAWPNGCPKTRSCSRNKGCMYGCAAHKDRDGATLRSEIEAAIAAASPAPPHQGGKSE